MKKRSLLITFLSLILAFSVSIGLTTTNAYAEETPVEYSMGDANLDGNVNTRDVVLIKQSIVGLTELTDKQKVFADVYADGQINTRDVVLIQQLIVGMEVDLGTHEHSFDQEVAEDIYISTPANCQEKATYYYSCICGEKGEETFKSGELAYHIFSDDITIVEPTCESVGYTIQTCEICDTKVNANFVSPINHTGNNSCSTCGINYISVLGQHIIETGVYSSTYDEYGKYFGYAVGDDSSDYIESALYYKYRENKIEFLSQTILNGSIYAQFDIMFNPNNYYCKWDLTLYSSDSRFVIEGNLYAPNFSSYMSYLPYTSAYYYSSSSSSGLDLSVYDTETVELLQNNAIREIEKSLMIINLEIMEISEYVSIRDFGFTGSLDFIVHNHNFELVDYQASTCEEEGYVNSKCYTCGTTRKDKINKIGHEYVTISEENGYAEKSCSYCKNTITEPIEYDIKYELDGGIVTNLATYTIETEDFILENPEKVGYKFLGWSGTDIDGISLEVLINKGSLGNREYIANWEPLKYTVSFNANGGRVETLSLLATYDEHCSLPIPERVGYTFDGWYYEGIEYVDSVWKTAKDITLVAEWKANTNTKYIVNHYQQNINDDDYSLYQTQDLEGVSDANVTPTVNTYTGFTSPTAQTKTIAPDGSLVIDYYYTRNYYTISFITNGGNNVSTISKKYQTSVTLPNTTRSGFTFGGWFTEETLVNKVSSVTITNAETVVYAWWSEENKPTDFVYSGSPNITISSYNGSKTTAYIPTYIGNKVVKTISADAFKNQSDIVEIVIPKEVTSVQSSSFEGCSSLIGIIVNDNNSNYKSIDGVLYNKNANTLIKYPSGKTATSYAVNSVVDTIEKLAFSGNKHLKEIEIPNNVKYIYSGAFNGCSSLESMSLPFVGKYYASTSASSDTLFGYIFGTTKYDGGVSTLQYYSSSASTTYYVPASLKTVTITDGNILYGAFYNCSSITDVIICENVESIGFSAFKYCSSLASITVPYVGSTKDDETNTHFGYIFGSSTSSYNTSYIPKSLKTVKVMGGTIIGDGAFRYCTNFESIELPSSITKIDNYSFQDFSTNTNIYYTGTIDQWVETDISIIAGFSAKNLYINNQLIIDVKLTSATKIGACVFSGCTSLQNIEIPSTVKEIGREAFYNCSSLTSIEIPTSVTSIGYSALQGCSSLVSLTTPRFASNYTFLGSLFGTNKNTSTGEYVPSSLKIVKITGNINIGSYAFFGCSSIESIELPNYITKIKESTFSGCTSLTSITIPNSVTSIDYYAFNGCSSLKNIVIPESVSYIGHHAFSECTSLENVVICGNILRITYMLFYNCTSLKTIVVPKSVTTIEEYAFSNCKKLNSVYYMGKQEDLSKISNDSSNFYFSDSKFYYYVENESDVPTDGGNYWHYVDGVPTKWE